MIDSRTYYDKGRNYGYTRTTTWQRRSASEETGHQRKIKIEKGLELDEVMPSWLRPVGSAERCKRDVTELIDGEGEGLCSRQLNHHGRHIACTSGYRIKGLGPWRELRGGRWVYYAKNGELRNGAECKAPAPKVVAKPLPPKDSKKATAAEPPKKAAPALPSVEVGKPCPPHILLDQHPERRCPAYGKKLDHLMCSRRKGHKGLHVATDTDAPGSEVLAVCNPE